MNYNPDRLPLEPGTIIDLSDVTKLRPFEDIVALSIDPSMSTHNWQSWQGRPNVTELVRPAKVNGTLKDIALEVMNDPYDRLLDARARGWKYAISGARYERTSEAGRLTTGGYQGYVFTADATSTGRGVIGQVQAELWYFPAPDSHSTWVSGLTVNRMTTRAVIKKEERREIPESARHIGLQALRDAIVGRLPGSIQDAYLRHQA